MFYRTVRDKHSELQTGILKIFGIKFLGIINNDLFWNPVGVPSRIRQPPLYVLLEYARAAAGTSKAGQGGGDYLEMLVDDSLSLPKKLPSTGKRK